jgi:hypothetical protein
VVPQRSGGVVVGGSEDPQSIRGRTNEGAVWKLRRNNACIRHGDCERSMYMAVLWSCGCDYAVEAWSTIHPNQSMIVAVVCVRHGSNRDVLSFMYAGQERVSGQAGRNADSCQRGTSVHVEVEVS